VNPESLKKDAKGRHMLRLFSRDLFADYLNLLSSALPTEVQLFLMLDCSTINCAVERLQLISLECFSRYHLILKGHCSEFPCLMWGGGDTEIGRVCTNPLLLAESSKKTVAVLLPSSEIYQPAPFEKTANVISQLHLRGIPFRLIPEAFLTVQWDGLDFLIVEPSGITLVGKRMLQGFCAAGGTVVTLSSGMSLRKEVPFADWLLNIPEAS